jgi:hypothetical protein
VLENKRVASTCMKKKLCCPPSDIDERCARLTVYRVMQLLVTNDRLSTFWGDKKKSIGGMMTHNNNDAFEQHCASAQLVSATENYRLRRGLCSAVAVNGSSGQECFG